MRKLIALLVVAAIGFYGVWPAWSGYRIAAALQAKDETLLASKIDFPSVRESLRPVVSAEVEKRMTQPGGAAGGLLGGDLKKQLLPRLVDSVLQTLVTPANVIRIANESGGAAKAIEQIVTEQLAKTVGGAGAIAGALGNQGAGQGGVGGGNLGGVLGNVLGNAGGMNIPGLPGGLGGAQAPASAPTPASAPKSADTSAKPSFGLGNLKSFSFDGPLGMQIALAKDAASSKPDVTVGIAFSGADWKLVKLIPNL